MDDEAIATWTRRLAAQTDLAPTTVRLYAADARRFAAWLAATGREGVAVRDEDVARLSPLACEHINLHERYTFALAEPLARGALRPLHDPTTDDALEG